MIDLTVSDNDVVLTVNITATSTTSHFKAILNVRKSMKFACARINNKPQLRSMMVRGGGVTLTPCQ